MMMMITMMLTFPTRQLRALTQNPILAINHLLRSRITRASQSYAFGILQYLHICSTLYANPYGGLNISSSNYIYFW
jgi:hypothetical protein